MLFTTFSTQKLINVISNLTCFSWSPKPGILCFQQNVRLVHCTVCIDTCLEVRQMPLNEVSLQSLRAVLIVTKLQSIFSHNTKDLYIASSRFLLFSNNFDIVIFSQTYHGSLKYQLHIAHHL